MLYPAALQKTIPAARTGGHTRHACAIISNLLWFVNRGQAPRTVLSGGPAWEQFIAQYSQEKREGRQKRAEAQSPSRQHRRQRWGGSFRGWQ